MGRRFPSETAQQLLAPVVEAAADFIVHADFSRVHRCEGEDCVLWFYDRTKARLRRWCSMETCGNRKKISAFRERKD